MARIRTIKPEFWDSPSVAKASPWARLLFIAMWNWADDYGRGTANFKELEGFAFPNDDRFTDGSGNTVTFRSLVAEVSDCFGVLFYEAENRPYFAIPTWDTHQRNEKRAKQSKHPGPPMVVPKLDGVADLPSVVAGIPRSSGPGTGEQGNRGTEEQGNSSSSEIAKAIRPDVKALLDLLDSELQANDVKKLPVRNKANLDAMRLLIDKDGYDADQVARIIRWCQADSFWRGNIMSSTKLREQFETLRAHANRKREERMQASPTKSEKAHDFINELIGGGSDGPSAEEISGGRDGVGPHLELRQ